MQKDHETQIISSPSTHPYYNAQMDVCVWIFNKDRRGMLNRSMDHTNTDMEKTIL